MLASAFTGGPEFRFAVMPVLHMLNGCPKQTTPGAKVRGNASLFEASDTLATVFDIGTVVFRCHGFRVAAGESRRE